MRIEVEQLAFRHLDRPVRPTYVDIFRDAVLDMPLGRLQVTSISRMESELGLRFSRRAKAGATRA